MPLKYLLGFLGCQHSRRPCHLVTALLSLFTAALQPHLPMDLRLSGKDLMYDESMKKGKEDVNTERWSPKGAWGLAGWSS